MRGGHQHGGDSRSRPGFHSVVVQPLATAEMPIESRQDFLVLQTMADMHFAVVCRYPCTGIKAGLSMPGGRPDSQSNPRRIRTPNVRLFGRLSMGCRVCRRKSGHGCSLAGLTTLEMGGGPRRPIPDRLTFRLRRRPNPR